MTPANATANVSAACVLGKPKSNDAVADPAHARWLLCTAHLTSRFRITTPTSASVTKSASRSLATRLSAKTPRTASTTTTLIPPLSATTPIIRSRPGAVEAGRHLRKAASHPRLRWFDTALASHPNTHSGTKTPRKAMSNDLSYVRLDSLVFAVGLSVFTK